MDSHARIGRGCLYVKAALLCGALLGAALGITIHNLLTTPKESP